MAQWTLKISGVAELASKLRALPDELTDQVLRAALRKAAEPMRTEAARLAPRGPDAPHLADSMTISQIRPEEGEAVAVAVGPAKDFYYGRFLEFGTKHMTARAFMRPAFDGQVEACLQILERELWAAVSRSMSPGGTGML